LAGWTTKLGLAAAGLLALAPAAAQEAARSPEATSAVRTFDPVFFARFNPVTAQDMVRQVPGFIIDNGSSLRGFGATAGNVLIDGQRPSLKTSIYDELGRISAKSVERIELIGAAAAGDIDVRGYSEIANVVLKPAVGTQVNSTYAALLGLAGERLGGRVGGSRTWKTEDLSVRLNAQLSQTTPRSETDITRTDAAGDPAGARREFSQQNLEEILLNGAVNWSPTARDQVNVNWRVMPRFYTRGGGSISHNPAGTVTASFSDDYTEKNIRYLDLGGDWEHKFSPRSSAKLILVNSYLGWKPRELFAEFDATGAQSGLTDIRTDNTRGEHVLRGVWTLKPSSAHTLEIGAEGAFNYRDIDRSLAFDDGTGFVPIALPFSSIRVEEERAEAFVTDTWRVSSRTTLELGFTQEISTIRTITPTPAGKDEAEKNFSYPKPRAVATWTPTNKDQFRLSLERKVSQLDFSLFYSNLQLVQNQLTIGNPRIVPQQTWETSLQWKRAIGRRGSVALTLTNERIDDVLDLQPSFQNTTVFTSTGNIGDGERWTGVFDLALPLENIGVKGGMLKLSMQTIDSSVTDPFSGVERRITNDLDYYWNIDFRQDLPGLKLAWGGDYSDIGDQRAFRLDEEQIYSGGAGDLDLFVETTYFKGLTVRLAADNLGDQPQYADRRFFSPNRFPGGVHGEREFQKAAFGPTYTLSLSGAF
jgi:hypothetical protein